MSYYEYHVARKYVQFENALQEIAKYSAFVGRKILFLTACGSSYDEIVTTIKHSFHTTCEEQANSSLAEKSPRYAGYVPLYHRLDGQIREMSFEFYNIENLTVCVKNIHEIRGKSPFHSVCTNGIIETYQMHLNCTGWVKKCQ